MGEVSAFGYWWEPPSGDESQMWRSHGGSQPALYQGPPADYFSSGVTMQDNFTASYGGFSFSADPSDLMNALGGSPNSGYTDVKSALSSLANQTEAALRANLNAYQSGALSASQAAANGWGMFNQMIAQMMSAGPTGQRSAAERDRRISNGAGLRWDWIAYYLDPIPGSQQTTGAATSPAATLSPATGLPNQVYSSGVQTGNQTMLYLAIGAVAVVFALKMRS